MDISLDIHVNLCILAKDMDIDMNGKFHSMASLVIVLSQNFYAPQLVPPGTAEALWDFCPSVRLSRPGTDSMPDEIETPGLHRMIAQSI